MTSGALCCGAAGIKHHFQISAETHCCCCCCCKHTFCSQMVVYAANRVGRLGGGEPVRDFSPCRRCFTTGGSRAEPRDKQAAEKLNSE